MAVIVFWSVACAASHLLATETTHELIADSFYFIPPALGLAWALQGLRWSRGRQNLAVAALAGGIAAHVVADLIWSSQDLGDQEPPFPSVADAFYLLSLPLLMACVLLLPTRPLSGLMRGRIVLDGLLGITSIGAFSWYFYLGPIVLDTDSSLGARLVAAAYPLGDLLLLSCLWLLQCHAGHPSVHRATRFLTVGLLLLIVGDSYYGVTVLHDQYHPACDGVFALALGFIGLSARSLGHASGPDATPSDPLPIPSPRHVFLPYITLAPLAVLVAHLVKTADLDPLATGVLLAIVVCVSLLLLRQMMVLKENLRLNQDLSRVVAQLQSLAATDALTGLPNRRLLFALLHDHLEQRHLPLSLLMVDVDHFKPYNDRFGHRAGDELLIELAAALRAHLPPGGVAARYGGEEFAIVLPQTHAVAARRIAERLRAGVASQPFPHRRITLSVGVVTAHAATDGVDPMHLIEVADRALYQAKRNGRNRVESMPVALPRRRSSDDAAAGSR